MPRNHIHHNKLFKRIKYRRASLYFRVNCSALEYLHHAKISRYTVVAINASYFIKHEYERSSNCTMKIHHLVW